MRPKFSSPPVDLFRPTAERPMPSAMMKGTVIGPVVTPPESNATAIKFFGTKIARTKTRM